MQVWRLYGQTLLIALLGASVFQLLHVPLAFMLGPMFCLTVYRFLTKREGGLPNALRSFALLVLGVMFGTTIDPGTGLKMISDLPLMLAATVLIILFSLLTGVFVARRSGASVMTGIFGSVPGGLTQMVLLSEAAKGVNVTVVTFMQTARLFGVIFIVPFLAFHGFGSDPLPVNSEAGATTAPVQGSQTDWWLLLLLFAVSAVAGWLGEKIKLPTAWMLGPMFVTSALGMAGLAMPPVPDWLILVAQVFIGIHVGLIMDPLALANLKQLAFYTLLSTILLVLFALGIGWLLADWAQMDHTTGFLSTAPGGMAEIGVTAQAVGADLSRVTGYHLFRIFFIMFAIPPLLMWAARTRT